MNEPYKTTMKRQLCEELQRFIKHLLEGRYEDDTDKMHMALLAEIDSMLYDKLKHFKPEVKLKFSPAQAFAIRLLFTEHAFFNQDQLAVNLHNIAFKIHQQYQ